MNGRSVVAAAVAACCLAEPAASKTYRVDDSASIPAEASATMRWREMAPRRGASNALDGRTDVLVRLDTSPWMGRHGRVFLVLPEQPIGTVTVEFTTQGRFLSGRLVSGSRALVYAGPINAPTIEERITLSISVEAGRLNATHALRFHFEVDIDE